MNTNVDLEQYLRKSVKKLEEARSELNTIKKAQQSPIAVIGMSCRMPGGANSIELFWQKLMDAQPLISEVPAFRWDKDKYYAKDRKVPGKMYSTRAGFIDGIDLFDAAFFGISRREALLMDPQQRLLLEETWQAFEVAGIAVDALRGSDTGVFMGCSTHDYISQLNQSFNKNAISAYYGTGNSSSVLAGRIAYFFDFQGPVYTLDTACSSSLVAVHEACMALRNQACSLAVAGGVNAIISPEVSINFSKATMLAEDGLCKTFDSRADGYVRGEGVGVVILKRLEDAIRDNDTILACLIGHGINHDGASTNLTSPNGEAQVRLLQKTLTQFNISPQSIDYVEAHGTGTPLGDPVEVNALNTVFAASHSESRPLYLGSVKTNIGHLEAAAGVAAMIKVILALRHERIPAHLNFNHYNPLIDAKKIPLVVPGEAVPWVSADLARRASVSSFGFSGTNSYLVLEEYRPVVSRQNSYKRNYHYLILSAKTKPALDARIKALQPEIETADDEVLIAICHTLSLGRVPFQHQLFVPFQDKQDLLKKLETHESYYGMVAQDSAAPLLMRLGVLAEEQAYELARQFCSSNLIFQQKLTGLFLDLSGEDIKQILGAPFAEMTVLAKKALVFSTAYSLLFLFKTWNIEADYVENEGDCAWVYQAFVGLFSPLDAFNNQLHQLPINEESLNLRSNNIPVYALSFFNCEGLPQMNILAKPIKLFTPDSSSWKDVFNALGDLNRTCKPVRWPLIETGYLYAKKILPTYPFERQSYWKRPPIELINQQIAHSHPLLDRRINSPHASQQYVSTLSGEQFPFLNEHRIYQRVLFPAAGYIELVYACLRQTSADGLFEIRDFQLWNPLILEEGREQQLFISINEQNLVIHEARNMEESGWAKVVTACVAEYDDEARALEAELSEDKSLFRSVLPPYAKLQSQGIDYGHSFQSIETLEINADSCLATINLKLDESFSLLGLLDGAFQAVGAFLLDEIDQFDQEIYLPHSFKSLKLYSYPQKQVIAYLKLIDRKQSYCLVDLILYDTNNQPLLTVKQYRAERVRKTSLHSVKALLNQDKQVNEGGGLPGDQVYYTKSWQPILLKPTAQAGLSLGHHFHSFSTACGSSDECGDAGQAIEPVSIRFVNQFTDSFPDSINSIVLFLPLLPERGSFLETYRDLILQLQTRLNEISNNEKLAFTPIIFVIRNTLTLDVAIPNPAHHFFAGLVKSLRLEHSHRNLLSCDFDAKESVEKIVFLMDAFSLASFQEGGDLAFRGDKVYQQQLKAFYPTNKRPVNNDQSYSVLITGGSSRICLKLAEQLLEDKHLTLILVARNQNQALEELATGSASKRVQVVYGDIREARVVNELISDIQLSHPPLKYILHAAGVLRDALFSSMTWGELEEVVSVKISPLVLLDKLCHERQIKLEKLIVFSSIATVSGGHGQAPYAAANALMEGYMHCLKQKNIPATALAFPAILESRMAASSPLIKRYPEMAISIEDAVNTITLAMKEDLGPLLIQMNAALFKQLRSHKLYQYLFRSEEELVLPTVNEDDFINNLSILSHRDRLQTVKQFLLKELGRVMQLNDHEFSETSGFFELGMDSLMAVELFEYIQKSMGKRVKLNSTLLFDIPNVALLSDYLIQALFPDDKKQGRSIHRVDQLSDGELLTEIEAMLEIGEKVL